MRNGNTEAHQEKLDIDTRSYRTYEEWKLSRWGDEYGDRGEFLPYLWGMETRSMIHNT